jgi:hypothetical protein
MGGGEEVRKQQREEEEEVMLRCAVGWAGEISAEHATKQAKLAN